jgi:hypothetical protein
MSKRMQKKTDFDKLAQEELARVHGTTARTIRDWDAAGHPRNVDNTYSAAASIKWRIDRELHDGLNLDAERARLARAQSEKAELDLRVRRGSLLERDEVIRDGQALVIAMRARLRALPARLAPTLSTPETYAAVRAQIAAGVDEALLEIADEKFASGVAAHTLDTRDGEGRGATAQVDGERVGRRAPRALKRGKRGARKVEHSPRRVPARRDGRAQ